MDSNFDHAIDEAIKYGQLRNGLTLTPPQKSAARRLIAAILAGRRWNKLEGFGGTGKSTACAVVVTALDRLGVFGDKKVAISSATHIATQNLENKLVRSGVKTTARTLAGWLLTPVSVDTPASIKAEQQLAKDVKAGSVIENSYEYGKRMTYIGALMEERYELSGVESDLSDERNVYALMIIDEYTLAKAKHRFWFDKWARNLTFILLGDSFQLSLPDDDRDDWGDDFSGIVPTAKLTIPLRAGGTGLPSFLAHLRHGPCAVPTGRLAGGALLSSRFGDKVLEDPHFYRHLVQNGFTKVVTWTHDERRKVTRGIRPEIVGGLSDIPMLGEPMIMKRRSRIAGFRQNQTVTMGEDLFVDDSFLELYKDIADEIGLQIDWSVFVPLVITGERALNTLAHETKLPRQMMWPAFAPVEFMNWLLGYGKTNAENYRLALAKARADVYPIAYMRTRMIELAAAGRMRKGLPEFLYQPIPLIIEYGYCLTLHSCQGLEFDKLCVIYRGVRPEPGFEPLHAGVFHDGYTARKWLYTAISRAHQQCRLIMTDQDVGRPVLNGGSWQQIAERKGIILPAGMLDIEEEGLIDHVEEESGD